MTDVQIIAHWRNGAREALDAAKLLAGDDKYDLALFHCHLAVEKVLKAAIIEKTHEPHPKVHNLQRLALLIREDWSDEEKDMFDLLSSFAIAARYDDPLWAQQYATAEQANQWIERVSEFFSRHLP